MAHCSADGLWVQRVDQIRRSAGHLRAGPSLRNNDRTAHVHRLHQRQGEALVQRRQHEELRKAVDQVDLRMWNEAGEYDIAQFLLAKPSGVQIIEDPMPHDHQRQVSAAGPISPVSLNQTFNVAAGIDRQATVARMVGPRNREHKPFRKPVPLGKCFERMLVVIRHEMGARCSVRDRRLARIDMRVSHEVIDHAL